MKITTEPQAPRLIKRVNAGRELFGEGLPEEKAELLPLQQALWESIQDARGRLREARDAGTYSRDLEADIKYSLAESYFLAAEDAKAEIDAEIGKAERAWRSKRGDAAEQLLALQRVQQRYGAMSRAELEDAIEAYGEAPAGRDPDDVDALAAAAVRAGVDVKGFRQKMQTETYDKPWLRDVPDLVALRRLYDSPLGKVRVLGPFGAEDVNIADLLVDTPTDGEGRLT